MIDILMAVTSVASEKCDVIILFFFFQAEDGIRDFCLSRGLGDVYKRQCDKTTPGQLMAAGRLNIPTIVVACGYQQSGEYKGAHVDIEEAFLQAGYLASGGITLEDLTGMADNAVRSPGVCAGRGTANSMHIVCEALGMALPGASPVLANSARMMDYVRRSGERIVQMVWDDY